MSPLKSERDAEATTETHHLPPRTCRSSLFALFRALARSTRNASVGGISAGVWCLFGLLMYTSSEASGSTCYVCIDTFFRNLTFLEAV